MKQLALAVGLTYALQASGFAIARPCALAPEVLTAEVLRVLQSAPSHHAGLLRLLDENTAYVTPNGSGLSDKREIAHRGDARQALFPDQASFDGFVRYLLDLSAMRGPPLPTYSFSTGASQYDYRAIVDRSECTLEVVFVVRNTVDEAFGVTEAAYMFKFARIDGAIRLIATNAAG